MSANPTSPAAQRWNRYEYKYVVMQRAGHEFLSALGEYMVRDRHCAGELGYQVNSIYCDSPDRLFFWEKLDGQKVRRKLRFRWYDGPTEDIYVEIKQRIDRVVHKRRVRWPLSRVSQTFDHGASGECAEPDEAVAAESFYLWRSCDLRPTVLVGYRRLAYHGAFDPELRVTLDTDLRFRTNELDAGCRFEQGRQILAPELSVLEIKFNDRVPTWLCRLIGVLEIRSVRLSKYCAAVDRGFYEGQFTLMLERSGRAAHARHARPASDIDPRRVQLASHTPRPS